MRYACAFLSFWAATQAMRLYPLPWGMRAVAAVAAILFGMLIMEKYRT